MRDHCQFDFLKMDAIPTRNRQMQPQPLDVLNVPGALLNIRTVEAIVGFKKSKINDEIKEQRFPPPLKLSSTCSRWVSDDIRAYLACRRAGAAWCAAQAA